MANFEYYQTKVDDLNECKRALRVLLETLSSDIEYDECARLRREAIEKIERIDRSLKSSIAMRDLKASIVAKNEAAAQPSAEGVAPARTSQFNTVHGGLSEPRGALAKPAPAIVVEPAVASAARERGMCFTCDRFLDLPASRICPACGSNADMIPHKAKPAVAAQPPKRVLAPAGMGLEKGIDYELKAQGLRRAESHESGWYVTTSYGKVWGTDMPLPEPEPVQAAVKLSKAQRKVLDMLNDGYHIHRLDRTYGSFHWLYRESPDDLLEQTANTSTVQWLLKHYLVATVPYTKNGIAYRKLELTPEGEAALKR